MQLGSLLGIATGCIFGGAFCKLPWEGLGLGTCTGTTMPPPPIPPIGEGLPPGLRTVPLGRERFAINQDRRRIALKSILSSWFLNLRCGAWGTKCLKIAGATYLNPSSRWYLLLSLIFSVGSPFSSSSLE